MEDNRNEITNHAKQKVILYNTLAVQHNTAQYNIKQHIAIEYIRL